VLPDRPARAPRAAGDVPPAEACVLAVDLGTSGAKAAVVSATGMLVAHAFEPVARTLTPDGGAEQDPDEWWSAVVLAARRALADSGVPPEQVIGVGCTAQWSGTVAVGVDGRALGRAIIWMDSRGGAAVRRTVRGPVNALGYDVRKVPRWIHRAGGVPSLSGKDPVGHILFLRDERPDVFGQTAVFLEPVDYLDLRLTGLARASFGSIALHWVTDNRQIDRVAYDPDLLAMAGLDRSTLPELVPTGAVLAGLADGSAAELGLPARAICTRRPSARVRWPTSGATSTSGRRRGSAGTSRSRRRPPPPTSPPSRPGCVAATSSPTSTRPAGRA
jgi:xylulokinase